MNKTHIHTIPYIVHLNLNIGALCRDGRLKEALHLLVTKDNPPLDSSTYLHLLQVCIAKKALSEGKQIHSHINDRAFTFTFATHRFLQNKLINMYDKCGSLVDARKVFEQMTEPDVCSWNMIIAAYRKHGIPQQALSLFRQMQLKGVHPNQFTFSSILPVCGNAASLKLASQIHGKIIRCGFHDVIVMNTLIDIYAKCGNIQNAREVFDKTPQRNVVSYNALIAGYAQNGALDKALRLFNQMPQRDAVSWNAIIAGCTQNGLVEKALEIFKKMQLAGVKPNSTTFATILPACAKMGALEQGMEIYQRVIESGFFSDVIVVTAMIDMYAKCGMIQKAHELFDTIPQKNVVSWNIMIAGYAQKGVLDEAVRLFKEMPHRNLISWTSIIAGYAQNGLVENALEVFNQMLLAGVNPDSATFASILPACAKLGALEQGMVIHQKIIKCGFSSNILVTALIDMYVKCGSILKARKLFDKMPHPDLVSWTAMIAGYAIHGYGKIALKLFELMKHSGINPNHVSFIGVLFACTHAGLVDEGCKYFKLMSAPYCIMPTIDHCVCMVDLLGRAGYLEEALNFIIKMPLIPNAVVWMCLLGACRSHKNIVLGEFVATILFALDPEIVAPYVLLSDIYAKVGRWSDVQKVWKLKRHRGLKKIPGCSWIEAHKIVHAFCAGDRSHPQTQEIYALLEKLCLEIKAIGYVPDSKPVLNDLEDEENELFLCHHSEKLAIAFGLLNTAPGTTIRVVKNLRVCVDCHTATKFISKIVAREIVVRDANRFHHFKQGHCSCGDYW